MSRSRHKKKNREQQPNCQCMQCGSLFYDVDNFSNTCSDCKQQTTKYCECGVKLSATRSKHSNYCTDCSAVIVASPQAKRTRKYDYGELSGRQWI